jgi:hypothetical protein
MGFEPTIPVLERVKTVHAFDSPANMIGELRLGGVNSGVLLMNTIAVGQCVAPDSFLPYFLSII